MKVPRELEVSLYAPIGPQRLADDTIVTDSSGWYRTLTPSSVWPGANEVLFSNLNERKPDEELSKVVFEYHELGLPVTWCVYPWTQPRDLGARLLARGASKSSIYAFLSKASHPLEAVESVDVERIDPSCKESYDSYLDMMSSGYDLPASEKAFRARRYYQLSTGAKPCMHLFLARCKGVVAGCQGLVVKEDSGHFTGAYIVPAFRAHGVFQSLIAAGLQLLRNIGISMATGHSNEQSAFWANRFGFQTIFTYDIYQLDAPSAG